MENLRFCSSGVKSSRGILSVESRNVERRTPAPVEIDALEGAEIERLKIKPNSPAADRTLAELELRPRTGANPDAGFRILPGDGLVVLGERSAIDAALELVDPKAAEV